MREPPGLLSDERTPREEQLDIHAVVVDDDLGEVLREALREALPTLEGAAGARPDTVVLDVRRGDGPPVAQGYTFPALVTSDRKIAEAPDEVAAAVRAIVSVQNTLKADVSRAREVGDNRFPPTDAYKRPLFAYGKSIHDNCERRAHYDAGQYVEAWGDEGHRTGYCLYKMGCKGPVTFQNCPNVGWNSGTNWPIGCGHPCIGCAEPDFWDQMTPFYTHLAGFPGFGMHSNIDKIGLWGTVGVGAAFAAHGLVKLGQRAVHGHPKDVQIDEEGGQS